MPDLIQRITGDRRFLLAGVGIALVIVVASVAQWATKPQLVPVASQLDLELSGKFADRLAEAGITYELERGGSEILVSEVDLARARVALARDGLATGGRPGLELFDQQTWGWNDFTQRINYRRALEGELERTISKIAGVEHADVHIAMGDRSAFRRDARPATASVVLAMRGGATPTPDVVRGVAQLVSSSVDGLGTEQVSVHDQSGRLWSDPADGSAFGLTTRQLRIQKEVETYLEQKAEAMVADVVGAGNVRVRVAAALNFDRLERTTQSVDPARQAIATEQKSEIIPGEEGGAASTTTASQYETTRSTETFSSAMGSVTRLTVAVLVNAARPAGTEGNAAAAAAPAARTPAEIAQLEALVRGAVGLDTARGDGITVVSAPFEQVAVAEEAVAEEKVPIGVLVERYQRPALSAVALLGVLAVAFLTLNALKSPIPTSVGGSALAAGATYQALPAANGGSGAGMVASAGGAAPMEMAPPPPRIAFPQADTQVRDRVVQTVEKDPDAAARLVKTWIKDA